MISTVKMFFTTCSVFPSLQLPLSIFLLLPVVNSYNYEYKRDFMAPIILVHGVGGCRIEGKWRTHGHPKGCDKKETAWKPFWLELGLMFEGDHHLKCWAYRFQLQYNRTTHGSKNQEGVITRVPRKFGSCKPSEYLTEGAVTKPISKYFHVLMKKLKRRGYSTDHSLKGAAYDWRYSIRQQADFGYFGQLRSLVESVASDTKRKVALVAHSMGGLMMAHFLTNQTQDWKDKYIQALITISTPWMGSPQAFEAYLIGSSFGIPNLDLPVMKRLGRTFPSIALLLPYEKEYSKTVLVDWTFKQKQYTGIDYKQLFTDIGYEDAYLMREDTRPVFPVDMDKFGVRTFCIWSNLTEHKTAERFQMESDVYNYKAIKKIYGEGDGTVPLKSLSYCERFKNVKVKSFGGPTHTVPGVVGSQIEGKWHTHGHPSYCDEKGHWMPFWIEIGLLYEPPSHLKCWVFRFKLLYDRSTHRCRNQDGVTTRIPGKFGSCKPSEYLSGPVTSFATKYFHKLLQALKRRGYSTDHSLKTASYDWRYGPMQLEEFGYFSQLTQLVEKVASDTNRKVALIAHSMGGLMMAYFLQKQTKAWKDKHIHVLTTVSTPWLGSANSLEGYLIGTNYNIPTVSRSTMRKLTRTFQSLAFLLPYEEENKNTVLVAWTLKNKTYTASDYQQLFRDIDYEDGYLMRQDLRSLFPVQIDKLGVRTFCVWTNTSTYTTLERYEVAKELNDRESYKSIYTEGDGVVSLESLRYCERFKDVTAKGFQSYGHKEIIYTEDAMDYIMSTVIHTTAFS